MDTLTKEQRSERMSRVKGKNTKPEILVRSLVHGLGFRFRLHDGKLPGKPDIVLAKHKKLIFVQGCFWHQHGKCRPLSIPKNNPGFWKKKFKETVWRDKKNRRELRKLDWDILLIWECETRNIGFLLRKLKRFLLKT